MSELKKLIINGQEYTITDGGAVAFDEPQTLTDEQKAQARENIGADGTGGVSVTHSWDGTTLIVTSASGTSSANLKGEKGETGDSGVYLLAEGENLEDAPAEAAVVVDPYGTADLTVEQVVAATLEVIENGTY